MGWQKHQMARLALEKGLMAEYFPDYQFCSPTQNTYLLAIWRSSRSNEFAICIQLPAAYPDECPSTYIIAPSPLLGVSSKTIESYRTSHAMHCWESDRPGCVKICTFRPEFWSASFTLVMVAVKAQLWLEALEAHRTTGKDIAAYLATWQE